MFLSNTQKEQIIRELNICSRLVEYKEKIEDIIKDVKENGIQSKYIESTDSSCQQVAIKINDDLYIYSEQKNINYSWEKHIDIDVKNYRTETMDFNDYNLDEIPNRVSSYAGLLDEHIEAYGDDWKQIALEYIFEQVNDEPMGEIKDEIEVSSPEEYSVIIRELAYRAEKNVDVA